MSNQRRQASMVVALMAALLLCAPASATEDLMGELPPVVDPFRCLICHQAEDPGGGDTSLNAFGDDFVANLLVWDTILAGQDSDGDNCTNGVELGDVDGDGENDGNVSTLQSNPGAANDCGGANVDQRTWGDLKALFDQN